MTDTNNSFKHIEQIYREHGATSPAVKLNPTDELGVFETKIRGEGEWCDTSAKDHLRHKFICRNPKSTLAISLCGQIVKPIEKLNPNHASQQCLICSIYEDVGKERLSTLEIRLKDIVSTYEETE